MLPYFKLRRSDTEKRKKKPEMQQNAKLFSLGSNKLQHQSLCTYKRFENTSSSWLDSDSTLQILFSLGIQSFIPCQDAHTFSLK